MSGRQITISVPEAPKVQQTAQQKGIKVTGNVSDEKGEPLIGVTIILKNDSTVHALTDMNGNYSIIVPERKSVLSFRYIGFVPKEEVVNNRKVVNVQMVEDVGQLDEVVVVAYGDVYKRQHDVSIVFFFDDTLESVFAQCRVSVT